MRILTCLFLTILAEVAATEDFGSNLSLSIKHLPASVDLAGMGGLNVCIPTPSGINPATNATLGDFGFERAFYAAYYQTSFSNGPDVSMKVLTAMTELGKGVLKLTYYDIDAPLSGKPGLGEVNSLQIESLEISYGLKLNDKLLVGLTVIPIADSYAESRLGPFSLGEATGRAELEVSGGLMYRPTSKINLALNYDFNRERVNYRELFWKRVEHPTSHTLRPGISIQPWRGATFGVEYMYYHLDNDGPSPDTSSDAWFWGGEQWLSEHFAIRAGCLNGRPTAGLGVRIGKNVFLDYSYVDRMAESLKSHWGGSPAHLLALSVAF